MPVRQVWITDAQVCGLTTLSIESEHAVNEYQRVISKEHTFPAEPTEEHPLRHVVMLSLFDSDDLLKIYDAIGKHLGII